MDKIYVFSTFIRKYSFWFLAAAMVVVGAVFSWMAIRSLAWEFQQRRAEVKEQFKGVGDIIATPEHPNRQYITDVSEVHKVLKKKVFRAWEDLYSEQKAKNTWPKDLLGKEFVEEVERLGPDEEIPYEWRAHYRDFIQDYFDKLFKIIDKRRPKAVTAAQPSGENTAGSEGKRPSKFRQKMEKWLGDDFNRMGAEEERVGVVEWDRTDLDILMDDFDWQTAPSSTALRLAQEDLWVIESLLKVIRATNGDETEHARASVKIINELDIGKDAIAAWTEADRAVFEGGSAFSGGEEMGMHSEEMGPVQDSSGGADQQLLKDRYVDDKGKPVPPGGPQPYAEFKMMPIRMELYMDQRSITRLLVECANSSMPIEVRRVRLHPGKGTKINLNMQKESGFSDDSDSLGVSGYFKPRMAGPHGLGSARNHGNYRPPHSSRDEEWSPRSGMGSRQEERESLDLPVEIQGIIYIYCPPDSEKLGTGAAREKPVESTAVPAEFAAPEASNAAPAENNQ